MESVSSPRPASPARFGAYLSIQFFSAFNDNVHFFAVALYLTYTASATPAEAGRWQAIAGAAFVLPFILLSPLAGTLADRYDKRSVLIFSKWTEVAAMMVSLVSTCLPAPLRYQGLILGIFLMEARSTFFSPAKYGILPEIVPEDRLVRANGILQMLTMVAIVSGEAIAGTLLHRTGLTATIGCCLFLSVVGSIPAFWIPAGLAGDRGRKIQVNPLGKIWSTFERMKGDRLLLMTAFTLSCFWMVSAIFRSNVPLFGKLELGVNEEHASRLMAFVSVGIGIGAALASVIRHPERSMILVLPGIAGLSVMSLAIGLLGRTFWNSGLMLAVLGFFGGLYLVPQTTIFQARSPADRRGEYLALQNFLNYTFMLFSALLFDLLTHRLRLSSKQIFIGVGIGLALLGGVQSATMRDLVLDPLLELAGGRPRPTKGEAV
jgi:acyl-[acyl-carrier-protein]-phospholipid O-acyltransferase/long-chain-fatty-acid--[acyl-carrier-protein] ligase